MKTLADAAKKRLSRSGRRKKKNRWLEGES
jgi:hypothetical protein